LEIDAKRELCDGRPYKLTFNLRAYESCIFEVPFHESTPEEVKKEKAVKSKIKREHKEVKNDLSHIPQVPPMDGEVKKPVKRRTAKNNK